MDSDPLVCAYSLLAAAPFLYCGLLLASRSLLNTWVSQQCLFLILLIIDK